MNGFRITRMVRNVEYSMTHPHSHDWYELYYLVSGKSRLFVNHTLYKVEAGDALLLAPGVLHRAIYPEREKSAERFTIFFPRELLKPLLSVCETGLVEQMFDRVQISVPIPARPSTERLMEKMEEELKTDEPLSVFLAANHLYELLTVLGRCGVSQTRKAMGRTEILIQQTTEYICQNYEKSFSLGDMAKMVHMTPTYYSRRFRQVTGFGFKEYVICVRIARAEKLLSGTRLSVTDIATSCGFGDGNYFGDVFKKVKGMSPSAYRRMTGTVIIT